MTQIKMRKRGQTILRLERLTDEQKKKVNRNGLTVLNSRRHSRSGSNDQKFAGLNIAEISHLPLKRLAELIEPFSAAEDGGARKQNPGHPEK